jgi:hypothetical protein
MTTAAGAPARYCAVCNTTPGPRGTTWCFGCRTGYGMAQRVLGSFRPCRPPPAVLRQNLRRYRRRASRGLPIFGGPLPAG